MQWIGRVSCGMALAAVVAAASPFAFGGPGRQAHRQAQGKVQGVTFRPEQAELIKLESSADKAGGATHCLRFWKGDAQNPESEITLFIKASGFAEKRLGSEKKEILAVHVARRGKNAVALTEVVEKDFDAVIQFGKPADGKQPGKVDLKTPTELATELSGTFNAKLP